MEVLIKLGASLRDLVPGQVDGEKSLTLPPGATVRSALDALSISPGQVRTIMLNHRPVPHDRPLNPGDRLALFPPECAAMGEIVIYFDHGVR